MSDWYLTWQDPVTLALAAALVAAALWFSRRRKKVGACARCAAHQVVQAASARSRAAAQPSIKDSRSSAT